MTEFEKYLELHEIDPIRLSIEAKVRYLTVYNAKKGNPITDENAQKIKEAVLRLTGVPYSESFVLIPQPSIRFSPHSCQKNPKILSLTRSASMGKELCCNPISSLLSNYPQATEPETAYPLA